MKQEKDVKIAVNVSSGAEKVETVEKQIKQQPQKKPAAKKAATGAQKAEKAVKEKDVDAKKMNAQSSNGKAERESEAAKARVAAALKKKEAQQKRKEERAKAKEARIKAKKEREEKRAAARKAMREKRMAERKAREEKRKALEEERARERAHAKAKKTQEKERAKKHKTEKSQKNDGHKKHGRDYGGWLAAVITLGSVTLALTAVVTVGAIEMKRMNDSAMTGYRATTYELVGIMENVDEDLDRARVSNSSAQQSRILTDLLVQARLAEADLEKMPVAAESDRNLTSYINHVAMESERMLTKLRYGGELEEKDQQTLERLYSVGKEVRGQLDSFAAKMSDDDISEYMKKGSGSFADVLGNLEKLTLEENNPLQAPERGREGEMPPADEMKKIDASKAEDYCQLYFSDYQIDDFQCIGETVGHGYIAYNVQGYDDKGTMLFAEIDGSDGTLLRFDYHEECTDDNFTMENAQTIAEEFLTKLGYEDLVAVRARENGTDVDFSFVYDMDGVVVYPDGVQVKVCRTRGLVTGMDATKYAMHHKVRQTPHAELNLEEASAKLHDKLEVESSRLALVQTMRGERLAYEFVCSYEDERYVVYMDAVNGEELSILNVKNLG